MPVVLRLATERDALAISDLYRPEVEATSISFEIGTQPLCALGASHAQGQSVLSLSHATIQ